MVMHFGPMHLTKPAHTAQAIINNVAESHLSNKTIRYEINNLFCGRHTTISKDITAVMQNIISAGFITRLYL